MMILSKKLKLASGLTLLTALAALCLTMTPAPEAKATSCHPHVINVSVWGSGATCAAAQASLNAAGQAQANFTCGLLSSTPCSVNVTPTNSCYYENGMYKIDGTVAFRCWDN